jgi:hypothetical protein
MFLLWNTFKAKKKRYSNQKHPNCRRNSLMLKTLVCLFFLTLLCGTVSVSAGEKRDTAMALLTGADSLATAGDHAKAADMCKRALAEDDTCPLAYFKLAQCQEQLSKPRDAFKSYRSAADLAKKENDQTLMRKATSAAEKRRPARNCAPGLPVSACDFADS